ncbi:DUF1236 domain-containing protein [Paracoccus aminophilus]|uniref:SH3b domain-containing protein n=1 Tax=Paracoccus aminophilus JCM 7686 TaxID=1367847 RepID=S5XVW9_PARAH|nr:DUF1236 domain-containing protein [Paracoccus aminophilus]AGT07535.1 hypothetical protein JCM7686_0426 [Paracoccus aminophilus JCM 7686]
MMRYQVIASGFMALAMSGAMSGAAMASTTAVANTDLNIRNFPDATGEIVGMITSGDSVVVNGCIEDDSWCKVEYGATRGWAAGDYLNVTANEKVEALYPNRRALGVEVIERPAVSRTEGAETGGIAGAAIGALVGGPVGAVVGAAIGGEAGASTAHPREEVLTYVRGHPVEPVILRGEVVRGAGIPGNVTLYDIPNVPEYKYLAVNGQTVLVDPGSRKIVYIYR